MTFTSLIYDGATGTNGLSTRTLTPDGNDTYSTTKSGDLLTWNASSGNAGTNLRRIAWPAGTPNVADTEVNATWNNQSAPSVQEGVAHRILAEGSRTRCITVTKNVIYDVFWVFNVHTWDTAKADGRTDVFVQVAQFDMDMAMFSAPSVYRPFPWRVSTQVEGNVLRFKVWFPTEMSDPGWKDSTYARSAVLPIDWIWPGRSGWYAGHIPPGGSTQYSGLRVWQ